MRKSVTTLVAFAFLLIFVGISSAKESGTTKDPAGGMENHKGDKGIIFSVSGLSSVGIGQYEGGIGGKFWISRKLAIISSLGVSAQRITTKAGQGGYKDEKTTSSKFSVFAGMEDHFFIRNKISPYLGGGIRFSTSSSTRYFSILFDSPPGTPIKEKWNTKTLGIRGSCGIEYFFADWVSLAGQYQIDYFYEKNTRKWIMVVGPGVTKPPDYKFTRSTLGLGTSSLVATFYIW